MDGRGGNKANLQATRFDINQAFRMLQKLKFGYGIPVPSKGTDQLILDCLHKNVSNSWQIKLI